MIMIELPVERVWLRRSKATRVCRCLVIEVSTDSVPDLLNVNATRSPASMPWTEPASLTVNGIVIAGHQRQIGADCKRRRAALQKQAAIHLVLSDQEFRHSPFKPRPLAALGHLFYVS